MSEKSDVDKLTDGLSDLTVNQDLKIEDQPQPVEVKARREIDDDGYISASSGSGETSPATSAPKIDASDEDEADDKASAKNDDEEVELEPLQFISFVEINQETSTLNAKGPIDRDSNNRFNPYGRQRGTGTSDSESNLVSIPAYENETEFIPKPNVMILTKQDNRNPTKLEVPVTWTNKYEICIERCRLPEDAFFCKDTENKIQLFVQLNPTVRDLKSFLADIRTEMTEDGQGKVRFIGPIVISLKTELADSQEERLLKMTTNEERTAAFNLVNQKEISQLTSGIGPHKDTVLSVLCAQRNPANPGQTFAQIHAVIQRLINHPDIRVKETVFKQNNNQISAFEIAAITNNNIAACYLAEVMYNLSPDSRTAIRQLNCKDTQGNTIIHLLARKGDSNQRTLRDLLGMKLTDGSRVFSILQNSKRQLPMHIATQNVQNQPETIKLLHQAMPRSFEVVDDDGMTALHYACRRTNDVNLVATILSYKKDNINMMNRDGMTPLDLVMSRTQVDAQTKGMFAIEPKSQDEIVLLLRNNGGKTGLELSCNSTPGSTAFYSSPQNGSPMGSPYSYVGTETADSPLSYSGSSVGGYYQQSMSPDSVNIGSPFYQQGSPYHNPDSPVQTQNDLSYEDQIANQILTEFPEITNVLGQILDENSQ